MDQDTILVKIIRGFISYPSIYDRTCAGFILLKNITKNIELIFEALKHNRDLYEKEMDWIIEEYGSALNFTSTISDAYKDKNYDLIRDILHKDPMLNKLLEGNKNGPLLNLNENR